MLTNQQRLEKIEKNISIAYYWLGEDNFACALSICHLLKQLDLYSREEKKVNELEQDINTMIKSKNVDCENFPKLTIPAPCKSQEDKLLWVTLNVLMNLFNAGNFEMGYLLLTEASEDWNVLYINIIPLIKASAFKEELAEWALSHIFFAKDILDKEEFEIYGYEIKKKDSKPE